MAANSTHSLTFDGFMTTSQAEAFDEKQCPYDDLSPCPSTLSKDQVITVNWWPSDLTPRVALPHADIASYTDDSDSASTDTEKAATTNSNSPNSVTGSPGPASPTAIGKSSIGAGVTVTAGGGKSAVQPSIVPSPATEISQRI
jgi:hypothetical protein